MSFAKIWLLVLGALLVATVVSSKQDHHGIDTGHHKRQDLQQKLSTPAYQFSPKQAALNEPRNRSKFNGKWTSLKDEKKKIGLHTSRLHEKKYQDLTKKMIQKIISKKPIQPLSQNLFQFAVGHNFPQLALNSDFMRAMRKGDLNPDVYKQLLEQDVPYLDRVATMSDEVALYFKNHNRPLFRDFFTKRGDSYETELKNTLNIVGLPSAEYVIQGEAVKMYIKYIDDMETHFPEDLPIALLACSWLWPWMANELQKTGVKPTNPYFNKWVKPNLESWQRNPRSTEKFVNDNPYFQNADYINKFQNIFCKVLIMEANLFREAGKEKLLVVGDYCPLKFY